jgi:hypothetical protein
MGVVMKKIIFITLAAVALTAAGSSIGEARRGHGHHHGGHFGASFFVGPLWGPGWGWPYYSYPYYPYYSGPPVVIQQQPDTYIQKGTQDEEQIYWYYCNDPEGYYPYVKKCPKGWLKVMPDTTPEGEEE